MIKGFLKLITYSSIISILTIDWILFMTAENESQQFFALIFLLTTTPLQLFLIYFFKKKISLYRIFGKITVISSVFLILFHAWNTYFIHYNATHDYSGNIFRGAFNGFISPLYGKVYPNRLFHFLEIKKEVILILIIMLLFNYLIKKRRGFNTIYLTSSLAFVLTIFFFAYHNSFHETFLSNNCHFLSFALDNDKFKSISDLLKNYVSLMPKLSVHNNHYPPGNVILSYLNENFSVYFLKSLVFSALLLSLYPFIKTMKEFGTSYNGLIFSVFIYISSGAILFFHGIALSPLALPLSISLFYFLYKGIKSNNYFYAIGFGVLFSIYTFFSFTSFTFILFCILAVSILLIKGYFHLKNSLLFLTLSVLTFLSLYLALFFITDFNIVECFLASLFNEKIQMDYSGINDWTRYFITSSGNFIAYMAILGPVTLTLFILSLTRDMEKNKSISFLPVSLLFTLVIFTFSNHFYLEVERIWIFLTPFLIMITGSFDFLDKDKNKLLLNLFVLSNLTISLWLLNTIEFCGFFL